MMKTLAKVAIGYAAARGVDRMSRGQGLTGLFGGGAQVKGSHPMTKASSQMTAGMQGAASQATQPMQALLDKMRASGFDLSAMMGGAGAMTGAGATPPKPGSGLLSSMPKEQTGMIAATSGAASMGGKGIGTLLDQFNAEQTAPELEHSAALMLRAMIQAAKSDGEIDADEKAKIMELVGDDATEDDIAFVREQLAAPIDVEALAKDTPEAQRMPVYSASLMTIRVDTEAEAQYLDSLAKALGLGEPEVNALHVQQGIQPLYA
ncbi:tellurite resistance TerB family protein [Roseivivax halodurans]|nr:tellurite resistance TerB family protein [Roseivivax halodurans]